MTTLANAVILLANLGVLGMTLKLYTEFFKESAQRNRAEPGFDEERPP